MTSPFLTQLDSRAAVKGSRDPLGIQSIWTQLGREVIGNLTTVSNSVSDFTTMLLGYYFVDVLAHKDSSPVEVFLRWEQLAAYARAAKKDFGFRGTERVRRRLNENSTIRISADADHQLLGNQKIYGLWGLYTVPGRMSGLVDEGQPKLTPEAHDFVESFLLPTLAESGASEASILHIISKKRTILHVHDKHSDLLEGIGGIYPADLRKPEREFYEKHLVLGGPRDRTKGRQQALASLLKPLSTNDDLEWCPTTLKSLAQDASQLGDIGAALSDRLDRIRMCEGLVAPASNLFNFLMTQDGRPVEELADDIKSSWGLSVPTVNYEAVEAMKSKLGGDATSTTWLHIAKNLTDSDYPAVIINLIAQNALVMGNRGGAAWMAVEDGRLQVRFQDTGSDLLAADELPELWRFPYFLDSLLSVAKAVYA